jgi:hypothetical protein
MTLVDLRKMAVRQQFKIRFQISNGMECVINDHGIAHVPALKSIPDFNLEKELETVSQFQLEPKVDPKNPLNPRTVTRADLEAMADASPVAAAAPDHDDE